MDENPDDKPANLPTEKSGNLAKNLFFFVGNRSLRLFETKKNIWQRRETFKIRKEIYQNYSWKVCGSTNLHKLSYIIMSLPNESFRLIPKKTNQSCQRPSKCDPCGAPCMLVCGTTNPNLTCRPGGRAWGRACGPVYSKDGRWITLSSQQIKRCSPLKIRGRKMNRLPYGFGLYARKLYPCGMPCIGSFHLPKPACNEFFYPMLPTKPGKIYSNYTFKTRGPPYTCPRPCIALQKWWIKKLTMSFKWLLLCFVCWRWVDKTTVHPHSCLCWVVRVGIGLLAAFSSDHLRMEFHPSSFFIGDAN